MNNSYKYIYLSYFMDHTTPLYGGGKGISISPDRSILNGDTANTKQLSFQNHSGTHIDFPNHFFENGETADNYPGFAPILANKLREKFPNLKVIGMDFISLTSYQNRELGREAHRMFLGGDRPILLVEDMDLSKIMNSPKSISCLPLLINGLDGSPVTIIASI